MAIDYRLLQQIKQAMHKAAAPVPPEEVTGEKPYVRPEYMDPQQPYVDSGPAVIPGYPTKITPENVYQATKTQQQKDIDKYEAHLDANFPALNVKSIVRDIFRKNDPDAAIKAEKLRQTAIPNISEEAKNNIDDELHELQKKIIDLETKGRRQFGLSLEQDFSATPEAQSYYEEKVHPLSLQHSVLDATKRNLPLSSAYNDVMFRMGQSGMNKNLRYAQNPGNDYGAYSDRLKKIFYRDKGNDIAESLKTAPWGQIGRAASITSKPLLNYLTPSKPIVSEPWSTRLGRVAAQNSAQALKAFPYADRGYGGFYPRVDPNKPATKPNIPYSPASHMDAGAPMLDRRFSRTDVNAAKPAAPVQQPAPKPVTTNLPAVSTAKPVGGGRNY